MSKKEYFLAFKEIFFSAINIIFLVADGLAFLLSLYSKSINIPSFVYWSIFIAGFLLASLKLIVEKNKQIAKFKKKGKKEKELYRLEKQDIEGKYEDKIEEVRRGYSVRGLSGSGLEKRAVGKVEAEKNRQLKKLKLKYRK